MPAVDATGVVSVGDVELAWEQHGAGERPLVLVHGFTGSRDDFGDVVEPLAAIGRTVLYDQRGHGGSSKLGREDAYDVEQLLGDLEGFLDAVGVECCDLLGHSLGGAVALRYALAHPDRLASLILMDTAAYAPDELRPELTVGAEIVRAHGMSLLVEQAADGPLVGEAAVIAERIGEDAYRRRVRVQLGAVDPAAFVALATALVDEPSIADRLGDLRCPTTVLVGSDDAPFLAAAEELATGIPGATLTVLPGGGHSPQKSAKDAWVKAVAAHLARVRVEGSVSPQRVSRGTRRGRWRLRGYRA
jgi:pimeloyl-ACP methyl ester carboxylesterase